jgi:hypothetical protein
MTAREPNIASAIRTRLQGIREWMAEEAPYVTTDQRHLDEHTPERAYWHYGYQAALGDVLALLEGTPIQERRSQRWDNSP